MSEGKKTASFWGVAIVAVTVAAVAAWPRNVVESQTSRVGQPLFEEFTDPLIAASLEIITFDEDQGRPSKFEVGKQNASELWTIKSRGGYPADAFDQMQQAATALVGLKILDVQTRNAEDHDDLGVIEPNLDKLQTGDIGIGRLVSFRDASNNRLASLVVGDRVKDDPSKRYVRIPGQDPVYVVTLDESHLTSDFRSWIEDDLLRLSSIEIGTIKIEDYLSSPGQTRMVRTRNYSADISKTITDWNLDRLLDYDANDEFIEPTLVQLTENDKPNQQRLNALANALDDLKIVDVVRKPEGMQINQKNNQDLAADKNALASLGQRGFYPQLNTDGSVAIYSANGELHVTLEDGVKYVIRFGNIAGISPTEGGDADGDITETGVNRYLLVTTEVDESRFPVPTMRPIPNTIEELKKKLASETKASTPVGDEKNDTSVQPAESSTDEDELTEEEWQERLEAEQEIITKENRRIMDERKDQLNEATQRANQLNQRFADWYYVIPEQTYTMLRIKRDQILESSSGSALPPLINPNSGGGLPPLQLPQF